MIVELGRVSEETKGQRDLPVSDGGIAPFNKKLPPGG